MRSPVGDDLREGLGAVLAGAGVVEQAPPPARAGITPKLKRPARIARHDWRRATVDLPEFAAAGLPAQTMGRGLAQDPMFFAAALAGGAVLAGLTG